MRKFFIKNRQLKVWKNPFKLNHNSTHFDKIKKKLLRKIFLINSQKNSINSTKISKNFKSFFESVKMKFLAAILIFLPCVQLHSFGAPATACVDLRPNHPPTTPSTGPPPFTLFVSTRSIAAGGSVSILITHPQTFAGFLVQPRIVGVTPIQSPGTFQTSGAVQTINCHGGVANSATHTENTPRSSQTIVWNAPIGFTGRVAFQ